MHRRLTKKSQIFVKKYRKKIGFPSFHFFDYAKIKIIFLRKFYHLKLNDMIE
jgi:hypothetical protein